MDQHKYKVVFEDFTKRHFIKNFEKKYKSQWNKTQDDIIFVCEHIENISSGQLSFSKIRLCNFWAKNIS